FPAGSDKRFTIRRARLKATYTNKNTEAVFQIDATERGVVLKDAFGRVTDPWTRAFSLKVGAFDRPFGFEVPYSSGSRESPERARWSQTIFPGERDLGASVIFQPDSTGKLNYYKAEAGFFNGVGVAPDIDFKKDFIGSLYYQRRSANNGFRIGVGASYYDGGVARGTRFVYRLAEDSVFRFAADSSDAFVFRPEPRRYVGANAQMAFRWPAGTTTLRGEYIQGNSVGTSSSTSNPQSLPAAPPSGFYVRNFNGAAFYFIHNILKTPLQLVLKYDWYDPNTDVALNDIGQTGSNLTAADIRFTTLGFGVNWFVTQNAKLLAYYAMPVNERTLLDPWRRDIKDNVLTLRMQYRF
ncbi:MAG TPA: porin, partial [Chitinophagales bacterium]|nr:porin [Chitinophagales bacterium]